MRLNKVALRFPELQRNLDGKLHVLPKKFLLLLEYYEICYKSWLARPEG
jgi:hypothetical protein